MRWPAAWKDPAALALLKGTAVNCLLVDRSGDLGRIVEQARQQGLQVADAASLPAGVTVVEGEWPGVKLSASGAIDRVAAGPTGNPWVDSNGWKIRLTAALHPGDSIWIAANPKSNQVSAESYVVAVADAAAHGGRWIISLDDRLASGIAGQQPAALETWRKLAGSAGFFAARKAWTGFRPEAVMGIISDYSGENEFLSQEILNLVARTNQQYRILLKSAVAKSSFEGLKAVLYPDRKPPVPELRKAVLAFVQSGGLLIAGPGWGSLPAPPAREASHPRYEVSVLGKGRVAVAKEFEDPYLIANDSVVLTSHRHDLLRFWNGGALSAHYTADREGRQAVVQMLFYATYGNQPTLWMARKYRTARLWTLNQPDARNVEMEVQGEGLELYLPRVTQYAAVELEA